MRLQSGRRATDREGGLVREGGSNLPGGSMHLMDWQRLIYLQLILGRLPTVAAFSSAAILLTHKSKKERTNNKWKKEQ
jgi:hypothetical protein